MTYTHCLPSAAIRKQVVKPDLTATEFEFYDYTYVFLITVYDLGAQLDQELTFTPHLHRLARKGYYRLRRPFT